ncbi:beta-aspartyl-peptidase (threonine type) [Edaphobacter modestus]|uniref:Isoaspartyl peptidase n=2 Tax=Edaphobacter modestus TaxID=388466 RepID=A0A4V2G458_9BACT|nr:beta-aspartyl-peptidase (threonine type) [Edaphobacter modestus]
MRMRTGLRIGVIAATIFAGGSGAVQTERVMAASSAAAGGAAAAEAKHKWAIVLHGGAGVIERRSMSAETDAAYRASLRAAIQGAADVLDKGGSSVDAVEAAIRLMEDDPLFNAGRGAVFTAEGKNELDSAVMDGATMKAGAAAGVTRTRHPISLARAVMEKSPHVMLIGAGADQFAASVGLEQVDPSYFFTERRWQSLIRQLKKEGAPVPARPQGVPPAPSGGLAEIEPPDAHKYGTVGVVALDRNGNIAAGTSTGGTQAKRWGRVGDSPIIGAGTYASNQSCAVSATGTGEYFIRLTVARTICSLVQYKGMKLQDAADEVVQKELGAIHGDGGVIAVAPDGQLAWSFNTPGMYRGRVVEGGAIEVKIYADEK